MREPRWPAGAYSMPPRLETQTETEAPSSIAAIECWRGSVDELAEAVGALAQIVTGSRNEIRRARISWTDGTQTSVRSVARLKEELRGRPYGEVLVIRVEVGSEDRVHAGTLIARRVIPGMTIKITSPDREAAIAAAKMVFQRMMIGYVDRLGGHRAAFVTFPALSPMLLIGIVINGAQLPIWLRLFSAVFAVTTVLVTFNVLYGRMLVSDGLEIVDPKPRRTLAAWAKVFLSLYRHKRTRIALTIIGSLALGVVGNKISDAIHWP